MEAHRGRVTCTGLSRPPRKFRADDGPELRLEYLVSANNSVAAKYELERRLIGQEVFGYTIEKVEPATKQEAALFKLPAGCIQLLG